MPVQPGKAQLHLTVTEQEKQWLAERASRYEDAPEGWYAVVLLRYGMRHADEAWEEMTARAKGGNAET